MDSSFAHVSRFRAVNDWSSGCADSRRGKPRITREDGLPDKRRSFRPQHRSAKSKAERWSDAPGPDPLCLVRRSPLELAATTRCSRRTPRWPLTNIARMAWALRFVVLRHHLPQGPARAAPCQDRRVAARRQSVAVRSTEEAERRSLSNRAPSATTDQQE